MVNREYVPIKAETVKRFAHQARRLGGVVDEISTEEMLQILSETESAKVYASEVVTQTDIIQQIKAGVSKTAENLEATSNEISTQSALIQQIKTSLEGKAVGGTVAPTIAPLEVTESGTYSAPEGVDGYSPVVVNIPGVTIGTATTKPSSNSTQISFTGLTAQPKMFAIVPTGNITLGSTRYVTGVMYDGSKTHGTYGYRASSSATSYYSASYFTWTYDKGTLTVKTSTSTNGGNFSSSATYQLVYVV